MVKGGGVKRFEAFGETKTLREWSDDKRCIVSIHTLYRRSRTDLPIEEIITTPIKRTVFDKDKKYGKLKVISESENPSDNEVYKNKTRYWLCKCDCGKESIVKEGHLKSGSIVTCGCAHSKCGSEHKDWGGYEEISGDFFYSIKDGAKRRNLEFKITIEYIWDLFLKQNRRCKLTNVELNFSNGRNKRSAKTASLDRIDNDKGYIKGNVRWVHKDVNRMKWILSDEVLFDFCKKICDHNKL